MSAMFQVFMSEAWNEVMDDVLYQAGMGFSILVFFVFIICHLLAAMILISVFCGFDFSINLELNEELKIAKQRRLGEEVADTHLQLPARIRIFEYLKPNPKVVNMDDVDCNLPKIRQSFCYKICDIC